MLRKIAATLALASCSAWAQVDFSGAYSDDGASFLIVTQRGQFAVVTSNGLLPAGAPAGAVNPFGFGIGVVTGNLLTVEQFFDSSMYCVGTIRYELTGPDAIKSTVVSIAPTARGLSLGITSCNAAASRTRSRLL